MVINTYSDGSEFTGTHLVTAVVLGAIGAAVLIKVQSIRDRRFYAKVRRQYEK